MKKLMLLMWLVVASFANTWTNMSEIVNIEVDSTKELKEDDVKKNISLYTNLTKDIRLNLSENAEKFYNQKEGYQRKSFLRKRIKINSTQGNSLAILRDEIEIEFLDLKYFIVQNTLLTHSLFKDNQNLKEELSKIDASLVKIQAKIEIYENKLEEKKQESTIFNIAKENLNNLKKYTKNYQELIKFQIENSDNLFKRETLLELLKVEEIINKTNNIESVKYINYYLSNFNTDVPRIILSALILFVFWVLNRILYHRILPLLKNNIDKIEKEEVDIFLNSFEKLKRPITYIVMLFGLEIAAKVLLYPHELNSTLLGGINVAYVWFFTMILLTLTDILFSTLIDTKNSKKFETKKEFILHGRKVSKFIIIIGSFLYALSIIGYDISAFLASLGIAGMAVALAAKDTLANLFGSMVILSDRPFKIGDWVTLDDGTDGDIEEIGIRSTKIRTFKRTLISVPNAKVANASIENWSRMDKRRIKHTIGVTYSTTAEQMRNILSDIRKMLKSHPDIHQNTIHIYFEGFGSSELRIFCYYFTKSTVWGEFMAVREDTNLRIMEIIERNKAEFAFPTQTIHMVNDKEIEREEEN